MNARRPSTQASRVVITALCACLLAGAGSPLAPPPVPGGDPPARDDGDEPVFAVLFPELTGEALERALHEFAEAGHEPLSYRKAREILYWILDNTGTHVVTIYDRRRIPLKPKEWPNPRDLNCEHLWPQSRGAGTGPGRTDLHHLRPCVPRINSIRSNLRFGVPEPPYDHDFAWKQGADEDGDEVFLPPPEVRGDIARALFYFSVRYEMSIADTEEAHLKRWHDEDPVDAAEQRRADRIHTAQGNENPFIRDPSTVGRIDDF